MVDIFAQIHTLMKMGGPVVMLLVLLSVLSSAAILYKLWHFSYIGIGRHKRARQALVLWREADGRRLSRFSNRARLLSA
ncbi:hypothetical protein [uncultured Cohaesibacter sp.]|uniref:hypothetical protein n=1 Tax=uncultured Cohaesibacter sp. TaxID=1002546 RepID=UPI0029C797BA|nr:hypothetical protein [uncultured Cohaesibacter sp.]